MWLMNSSALTSRLTNLEPGANTLAPAPTEIYSKICSLSQRDVSTIGERMM